MAGIPLAVLRADLDEGWPPGARWIAAGGVGGAVLEQPAGSSVAFDLRADGAGLRLRAWAELEAAGRGRATVRIRVATVDPSGNAVELWAARLRRLRGRGAPARRRLDLHFEVPAGAKLVLSVDGSNGEQVRWSKAEIDHGAGVKPATAPASRPVPEPAEEHLKPNLGKPRFSILTPVHDPPLEILEETVNSVLTQTYEDWELCLVDDGSSDPEVREALRRAAAADPRVHHLRRENAGGIAVATNAALEMARGEFIAMLDHDDLLVPDALARVDAALRVRPETDMVYSDERLFGKGGGGFSFAKPHWSPDLLRSQMYTCHLGVYRRSLAEEVGGFRSEFDGAQDFDFVLRISELSDRVVHIPRVLYRWRAHAGSTAASTQAKPAAYPAARRAIAQHLERIGVDADVHFGPWQGIYRVVHRVQPGTSVAVGIVDRGGESTRRLAAAIADEERSGVRDARIAIAPTIEAVAAQCGDADVIILCESAAEPLTRLWLARLAGFGRQPGVAAVGARTLAPDGRVENGGFVVDAGLPIPIMFAAAAADPGPLGIGLLPANVSAVGGVVAIDGEIFRCLGGLEDGWGELALLDYCLRGLSAGLRVVSAPDVLLRRLGRPGVGNDLAALERFQRRWAGEFERDPYFELAVSWPGVEPAPASG